MSNCCTSVAIAGVCITLACGGSAEREAPSTPTPPLPAAADLVGEWRSDYVTAGAVSRNTRLAFSADGRIEMHSRSMTSLTEPPIVADRSGRYEVGARGVVSLDWEDDGHVDSEDTFVEVTGRALSGAQGCCRLLYGGKRFWTFRGFLAEDSSLTRFRRETLRHAQDATSGFGALRTTTTLALSASPARLAAGEQCSLGLAIQIETSQSSAPTMRSFELDLPCAAREESPGFWLLLFPGHDVVDGQSLAERPYSARPAWQELLAEHAELTTWPDQLRAALERAFEPYLAVDLERPHVLLHQLDANGPETNGYAWVNPG